MSTFRNLISGPDAVLHLASLVKPMIASNDCIKCVIDSSGDSVFAKDITLLLKLLDIEHPVGHFLVSMCLSHHKQFGSGVKTLLTMTGLFISAAVSLKEQGIPVTDIITLMQKAVEECMCLCEQLKICLDFSGNTSSGQTRDPAAKCGPLQILLNQKYESQTKDSLLDYASESNSSVSHSAEGVFDLSFRFSRRSTDDGKRILDRKKVEAVSNECEDSGRQIFDDLIDDEVCLPEQLLHEVHDQLDHVLDDRVHESIFHERNIHDSLFHDSSDQMSSKNKSSLFQNNMLTQKRSQKASDIDDDDDDDDDVSWYFEDISAADSDSGLGKIQDYQKISSSRSPQDLDFVIPSLHDAKQYDSDFEECFEDVDSVSKGTSENEELKNLEQKYHNCNWLEPEKSKYQSENLQKDDWLKSNQSNDEIKGISSDWTETNQSEADSCDWSNRNQSEADHKTQSSVNDNCNCLQKLNNMLNNFNSKGFSQDLKKVKNCSRYFKTVVSSVECMNFDKSLNTSIQNHDSKTTTYKDENKSKTFVNTSTRKEAQEISDPVAVEDPFYTSSANIVSSASVTEPSLIQNEPQSLNTFLQSQINTLANPNVSDKDFKCFSSSEKIKLRDAAESSGKRKTEDSDYEMTKLREMTSDIFQESKFRNSDVEDFGEIKLTETDIENFKEIKSSTTETKLMSVLNSLQSGTKPNKSRISNCLSQSRHFRNFGDSRYFGSEDGDRMQGECSNVSGSDFQSLSSVSRSPEALRASEKITVCNNIKSFKNVSDSEKNCKLIKEDLTDDDMTAVCAETERDKKDKNVLSDVSSNVLESSKRVNLTVDEAAEGLSHGLNGMMKFVLNAYRNQQKTGKTQKNHLNLKLVHSCVVEGRNSQHSQLVDGLILSVDWDQFDCIKRKCETAVNILLVNGDVSFTFRHTGYKAAAKVSTVLNSVSLHRNSPEDEFISECLSVLKKLELDVILVHGRVDSKVKQAMLSCDVVVMETVDYRALEILQVSNHTNCVTYLNEATQTHVCTDMFIDIFKMDWMDTVYTQNQPCLVSVKDSQQMVQTFVSCHPSKQVAEIHEQEFWQYANRLSNALQDERVLPGGGTTEHSCSLHLFRLSETPSTSRQENIFYKTVCETLSESFLKFYQTVQQNCGNDQNKSKSTETGPENPHVSCTNSLSPEIFDNCKSKMAAWQTALDVVSVIMRTDSFVVTGFAQSDVVYTDTLLF